MPQKYFFTFIIILVFCSANAQAHDVDRPREASEKPVYVSTCDFHNPTNARPCIVQDLPFYHYRSPLMYKGSQVGLAELAISGSSQPDTSASWQTIKNGAKAKGAKKFYDVDLRQETHGYLNGLPITLVGNNNDMNANLGSNGWAVERVENRWLRKIKTYSAIDTVQVKQTQETATSEVIPIHSVENEKSVATKNGFVYRRIPLMDRAGLLTKKDITQLVAVIHEADEEHAWIHFHCREGEQRTTTAMVVDDVLHNAKKVSFKNILARASTGVSPPINFEKYPDLVSTLQKFYDEVVAGKYEIEDRNKNGENSQNA